MLTNIWRYSHFALAVSSALFIVLATVTGIILALEPIENQLRSYALPEHTQLSLADVVDSLQGRYEEVLDIEVNADHFVKAAVVSWDDESLSGDFYVDPSSGAKIADIPDKRPLFKFMTNLHRSLFLKTPGRIFVGVTSFFLFLIALTGGLLFIKRQRGLRNFFAKVVKEDFAQYYHVVSGRVMLIPVAVVALTGVYLSLLRFSLIPDPAPYLTGSPKEVTAVPELPVSEFDIFRQTPLSAVRKLEFPFSSDVEDFYVLDLQDRQLKINQKTGEVIEERRYPFVKLASEWSFNVHTGTGSILWSLVLTMAGVNILYFVYSGALISYRRLTSGVKNKFTPEEAEFVILVGSENGSTRQFGKILQQALIQQGQRVFLDDLNGYQSYPNLKQLVILTSTYGTGDPPANAGKFLELFAQHPPAPMEYAVVGFGSLAYPDFCQFALDIDAALKGNDQYRACSKPFLIHNKSYTSFQTWANKWSAQVRLPLELPAQLAGKKVKLQPMTVIDREVVHDGYNETFLLRLKTGNSKSFQSGDLLAVYPPDDPIERQYSIARVPQGQILLSIKLHEQGLCSNYLRNLGPGDTLQAGVQHNKGFHLPSRARSVILIANGTGMAPFLGMIEDGGVSRRIDLFWGGRNHRSYSLYQSRIEKALAAGKLHSCRVALSQQADHPHKYVQDLVKKEGYEIVEKLKEGGTIMICGSIAMQNGVLEVLEERCKEFLGIKLDHFQRRKQILMDCY